ncbi:MAG: hypothetical protein ACLFVK_02005 [Dehalococcoidia bacterium]
MTSAKMMGYLVTIQYSETSTVGWNNDMTMQVPDRSVFSPAALKWWDELGPSAQGRILSNVWCATCQKPVHMFVRSAQVEGKDLILSGGCLECGGDVTRVLEGE